MNTRSKPDPFFLNLNSRGQPSITSPIPVSPNSPLFAQAENTSDSDSSISADDSFRTIRNPSDSEVNSDLDFSSSLVEELLYTQPPPSRRKMDRSFANEIIPTFSGLESELARFVMMVEQADEEDDKRILFKVVLSKLRGRAFEMTRLKTYTTWAELKRDFQSRFLPTKTLSQLQLEVANARATGSVHEFADRLNLLLQSMNQAVAATIAVAAHQVFKDHNEKLALKAFIAGVSPQTRTLLLERSPATLDSAISIVEEAESYGLSTSPKPQVTQNYSRLSYSGNIKTEPGTFSFKL
jgi:hypothetical protein